MKGTTRLLALCGVLTALGVVLLCVWGHRPFALYICPILASIALLLPVRSRPRYAWCSLWGHRPAGSAAVPG